MKQFHDIQLHMLKKLLFSQGLRYSELKPDPKMENNQLSFHLDTLMKLGYIEKNDQIYVLTPEGKEYANRIDTEQTQIQQQAKVAVLVCCVRGDAPDHELLIYTRKKQPFFGKQWFPTGKVKFGETVVDAARRELKEESNLDGIPELVYIKHSLVYEKTTHKLLEDKFFYMFLVKNPSGDIQGSEEWPVARIARKDFATKVTNTYYDYDHLIQIVDAVVVEKKWLSFEELTYEVEDF